MTMFLWTLSLLTITGYLQVQSFVTVPEQYRNAELTLHRYSSSASYNPIVHSLLNVLIHNKQARAFIADEAIEQSLDDIKKFDENDELNLRQLIYGTTSSWEPTMDLKEYIQSALDTFFENPNTDDKQTFDLLLNEKKRKSK